MIVRIRQDKTYPDMLRAVICDDGGTEMFELESPHKPDFSKADNFDVRLPGIDWRQLITMT